MLMSNNANPEALGALFGWFILGCLLLVFMALFYWLPNARKKALEEGDIVKANNLRAGNFIYIILMFFAVLGMGC